MSGSSINFEPIRNRHPAEAEAIARLERRLSEALQSPRRQRWTLDRWCDLVNPRSRAELALILGELVARGILVHEIHVESSYSHEVLERFPDLSKVPDEIFDHSRDVHVPVAPDSLRFVYATPRTG